MKPAAPQWMMRAGIPFSVSAVGSLAALGRGSWPSLVVSRPGARYLSSGAETETPRREVLLLRGCRPGGYFQGSRGAIYEPARWIGAQ